MIISLIVCQEVSKTDVTRWVTQAWDEYTISENYSGWEEALNEAEKAHGAGNVRVVHVEVPRDTLDKPFNIPKVAGTVKVDEP